MPGSIQNPNGRSSFSFRPSVQYLDIFYPKEFPYTVELDTYYPLTVLLRREIKVFHGVQRNIKEKYRVYLRSYAFRPLFTIILVRRLRLIVGFENEVRWTGGYDGHK